MQFKGIIFDLDGTLLDTIYDIGFYVNLILKRYSYPEFPMDEVKNIVGWGLKHAMKLALPAAVSDNEVSLTKLTDELIEEYNKKPVIKSAPYEGIPEVLDILNKKGIVMSVLSNKAHPVTVKVVQQVFGTDRFRTVLGLKEGQPRKPDPAGAFIVAKELGVPIENILYIGDTDLDHKTAMAAGFSDISVLWGFRSREQLQAAGICNFISKPCEILKFFE